MRLTHVLAEFTLRNRRQIQRTARVREKLLPEAPRDLGLRIGVSSALERCTRAQSRGNQTVCSRVALFVLLTIVIGMVCFWDHWYQTSIIKMRPLRITGFRFTRKRLDPRTIWYTAERKKLLYIRRKFIYVHISGGVSNKILLIR